jgi:translocation and assembly module TamA
MHWFAGLLLCLALALLQTAYAKPEIVIDPGTVDPAALKSINDAVEAIARLAADQDGGEADRLRRRARDAALAALATQGYFAASVTLKTGSDVGGGTWDIAIDAGVRARIVAVELSFTGRISRAEYADRVAALRKNWLLPVGRPFVNDDWNKAKSELLDGVMTRDFLLARIAASSADVQADQGQVRLKVVIDSGPAVRMGLLTTQGLERVPASLIKRYVRYNPGDAYDQDKLNQWQQALQGTAFFRGAFVSMQQPGGGDAATLPPSRDPSVAAPAGDPRVADGGQPAPPVDSNGVITLPVQVRVVEAPPKRFSASIGVDSDAGVGVEAVYRQQVVFGQPVTLESGVGVNRLRQRVYADFHLPPDTRGNKDSIGVLAEHSDIQGLDVTRFAVGATRLQERSGGPDGRVDYETRWGLLAAHDSVKIDGDDEYSLPTLTATADWLRRNVDSKYNPRDGNLIAVGGGVGVALNTGQPYTRARLRGQRWWPVGQRDVFTLRGEVGRVWASRDTQVPDDFGFRTGGARSIRGYRYLSIGADRGDAVVGAPALVVGSIEYDHYFDDRWGIGVFVDAGDAAQSFGDMDMAVGYGVGARVRTPAGPLFLDVAYGQRDHSVRLNFSLGIAF